MPVAQPVGETLRWGTFGVNSLGAVIVRVTTDEGIIGYGEAGPHAMYAPTVTALIKDLLKPAIVGLDILDRERAWDAMYRCRPKGTDSLKLMAISGIDIALWDIAGQIAGMPITKLLGGCRDRVRAYAAPSLKEPDIIERECAELAQRGFTAVKLRLGLGVERDLELVRRARQVLGQDLEIIIDFNQAYRFPEVLGLAERLEEFRIQWFEEPVPAHGADQYHREMGRLTGSVHVPVSGGETLSTRWEFGSLVANQAVQIVQPDCTWVGGISECVKVVAMASAFNIGFVPHVSCSSIPALGLLSNLHVAASTPQCPLVEWPLYETELRANFLEEPLRLVDGYVEVPKVAGLGPRINMETLARYALRDWA